jgi:hypothetical protein
MEKQLKENEIVCEKFNQSLESKYQNDDHYSCVLSLSEDGTELIVSNYKAVGYKKIEQETQTTNALDSNQDSDSKNENR